jgi:hypothetical protein
MCVYLCPDIRFRSDQDLSPQAPDPEPDPALVIDLWLVKFAFNHSRETVIIFIN